MTKDDDKDIVERLKEAFSTISPEAMLGEYPREAMKPGTFVRSHRLNRLGVITDAFYGELDEDNQKIIIYTILILPKSEKTFSPSKESEQYYMTNEYEYEVTGYLMLKPVDIKDLSRKLNGGLFF